MISKTTYEIGQSLVVHKAALECGDSVQRSRVIRGTVPRSWTGNSERTRFPSLSRVRGRARSRRAVTDLRDDKSLDSCTDELLRIVASVDYR